MTPSSEATPEREPIPPHTPLTEYYDETRHEDGLALMSIGRGRRYFLDYTSGCIVEACLPQDAGFCVHPECDP